MPSPDAVARLRCPLCHAGLAADGRALVCARGHCHDVARHGYVTLTPPRRRPLRGDPAAMVRARAEFLAAGHYAPIAAAVAAAARREAGGTDETGGTAGAGGRDATGPTSADGAGSGADGAPRCVVDLGAGTGYVLARVLDALAEHWTGIAVDASRDALRHAVRADGRIAGVAADVWDDVPVRDGAADLVLSVFAPRNPGEVARVLAADGALVVVTPTPAHLGELRSLGGVLTVEAGKRERLRERLAPALVPTRAAPVEFSLALSRTDARNLVVMGPSGHHVDPAALDAELARRAEPIRVTASVVVEEFRRAG